MKKSKAGKICGGTLKAKKQAQRLHTRNAERLETSDQGACYEMRLDQGHDKESDFYSQ